MRMGKFNEPSHSDITSTCEIFQSSDAANLGTILLALFCFHMHFPLRDSKMRVLVQTATF